MADWVPAEGDGLVRVDFTGAPTTEHEDYRYHWFEKGMDCQGEKLHNWLFVIPDGVAVEEQEGDETEDQQRADGTGARVALDKGSWLNHTNLRVGNLRSVAQPSSEACAQLCDSTEACKAWVFAADRELCFLKNDAFCVNNSSDSCGGCESSGAGSPCPCTAGIKPGVPRSACGRAPKPAPPKPRVGRACGRMGFASKGLTGPYKYCGWVEQPNPQGLEKSGRGFCNSAGGPGSNCNSWPGDLIEAKDGSLFFVNGWGNICQNSDTFSICCVVSLANPGKYHYCRQGIARHAELQAPTRQQHHRSPCT